MRSVSRPAVDEIRLTEELVWLILGWRSAPGRFLKVGRGWLPKWRFAPFDHLENAFELLESAADHYCLSGTKDGHTFTVKIAIGSRTILASGRPPARTITIGVARALGLKV
jgi:hypothetical protein